MLNRAIPNSVDEGQINFQEGLQEPQMIVILNKYFNFNIFYRKTYKKY